MTPVTIRTKTEADAQAVFELNERAFGRPDEGKIISQLEADGDVLTQLVAEADERIVGHILFYPLGVRGKLSAAGLGPMCVDPWVQRDGIGSKLAAAGMQTLREAGVPIVFVLGHADYYPRFGFSVEAAAEFETPVKGPNFMAHRMRFGPPMSGELIFPPAFGVASV